MLASVDSIDLYLFLKLVMIGARLTATAVLFCGVIPGSKTPAMDCTFGGLYRQGLHQALFVFVSCWVLKAASQVPKIESAKSRVNKERGVMGLVEIMLAPVIR